MTVSQDDLLCTGPSLSIAEKRLHPTYKENLVKLSVQKFSQNLVMFPNVIALHCRKTFSVYKVQSEHSHVPDVIHCMIFSITYPVLRRILGYSIELHH